ncbi:hypothetical protein EC973_001546 [Apophysomyces ossiformis]|uniref:Uncharacterized protein n=1 Tax=Apophysomyces ossiformis TaxID=679940 RepID=A0A8H7BLU9_9FUNG|nr:hypothetical protein EC973_001546 [Apophysomyces ossiformis]
MRHPIESIIYKWVYDANTKIIHCLEAHQPSFVSSENSSASIYHFFVDPIVSIYRVVWNPNQATSGWIASGGAAGLCRVEFIGCGPDDKRCTNVDRYNCGIKETWTSKNGVSAIDIGASKFYASKYQALFVVQSFSTVPEN